MMLAYAVLAAHVAIILFNLFGLVAVPLGGLCGWRFVRFRWWRILHIVLLVTVAVQAPARPRLRSDPVAGRPRGRRRSGTDATDRELG